MKNFFLPFSDGMLTGLILQLALGPVFFYILTITMDSNFINSMTAITAVTIVDYFYIILSLIGIGKILEKKKIKSIFGIISAIVLTAFGILIFYKAYASAGVRAVIPTAVKWTPITSFASCFVLTLSSPLTIVFWSSIFSAKAIEKKFAKQQLIIFGIGTGASTFFFLSIVMLILSQFKHGIPDSLVLGLNLIVGALLIYYGVSRLIKGFTCPKV